MSKITKRTQAAAARMEKAALASVTTRDGKGRFARKRVADSFQNFALNLGIGTDNALSGSTYGFNPISRNRTLLEWMHRGSWIAGMAVDVVAEDMTRGGIDILCDAKPEDINNVQKALVRSGTWAGIQDSVKWARLYGGACGYIMVDGQDPSKPLNPERVGKGQYRGVYPMDRWMIDPSLNRLVAEKGRELGLPEFYQTATDVSGLRFGQIHHSRMIRLIGIQLPYWQAVSENLWGISVLERLYDRMIAFDSATQGAAQLTYKAHLRTFKVKGLRQILAAGGHAQAVLQQMVEVMRRFQSIEGITIIDAEDEYQADGSMSVTGIAEALLQFGQQLSGALQIPLVRMFGQSPAGLNSTGESDLRTYYDGIQEKQMKDLHEDVVKIVRIAALSEGIALPKDYAVQFRPLWQLSESEKSEVAERDSRSIRETEDSGLISQQTALKELQTLSKVTGRFTNVTDEDIEEADDELAPRGEDAVDRDIQAQVDRNEALGVDQEEEEQEDEDPKPGKTKDAMKVHLWQSKGVDIPACGDLGRRGGNQSSPNCVSPATFLKSENTCASCQAVYLRRRNEQRKKEGKPPVSRWNDEETSPRSSRDNLPIGQFAGLDIAIECPRGMRRWTGGPVYSSDYGYIRRAPSAEGPTEWLDCFLGPERNEMADAYVIDGFRADGEFDEHKVMLGYADGAAATAAWKEAYAEYLEMGACTRMTMDQLRGWIARGDVSQPLQPRLRVA
jgi:uncharacterized protein